MDRSSKRLTIDLCTETLQGSRERQEDYYVICRTQDRTIAIVCDGMGGMRGGNIASRTAADMFRRDLEKTELSDDMDGFFRRELEKLDDAVYCLQAPDGSRLRAGTTLVAVILQDNRLYWFSVGDSRLFCVREGEIYCVTRVHNYAMLCGSQPGEAAVRHAESCEDAKRGEQLISYLGMGIAEIYDSNARPFVIMPGDKLILCTDGLYRTVELAEMARILFSSDDVRAVSADLKSAVLRKKRVNQDNATWVVVGIKEYGK